MKLTKGKIEKICNLKKQSRKRFNNNKIISKKNITFSNLRTKNSSNNLHNKTIKKVYTLEDLKVGW
jgi:hypothetical protein